MKLPPNHRAKEALYEALPTASSAALADAVERIASPDVSKMFVPERKVLEEAARRVRAYGESLQFRDERAEGIAKLRRYARNRALLDGVSANAIFKEVLTATEALIQELCVEHDVNGVRYWVHYPSEIYFSTAPGDSLSESDRSCVVELTRVEFMGRQHLGYGYEDRI